MAAPYPVLRRFDGILRYKTAPWGVRFLPKKNDQFGPKLMGLAQCVPSEVINSDGGRP